MISLFTGVGGLDFGFEAAGFQTAVAVEIDPVACEVLKKNRPWEVIDRDIKKVSSDEILKKANLEVGEADILIGGPPCQPFSKSGYWFHGDALRLRDPRADTLANFLRVLHDTKPRTFLLENVPGMVFDKKKEGFNELTKGIQLVNKSAKTKYSVNLGVLNAADYGVPQLRERIFIIGARDGTMFEFPKPTFSANAVIDGTQPYRTAWDALADLPADLDDESLVVGGKWGALLPSIPEGQNYLWHTPRGDGEPIFGWRTRYWCFLLKLAKDSPSWTIQAQPGTAIGPFHWRNRRLSARELCRLQTFPRGLRFGDSSRFDIQRLLGNAVPSLLAEVLAWEIRRQLLGRPGKPKKLKLLPPARRNRPDPEEPQRVPDSYKSYHGNHADHPGEGKGPGAVSRPKRPVETHPQVELFPGLSTTKAA